MPAVAMGGGLSVKGLSPGPLWEEASHILTFPSGIPPVNYSAWRPAPGGLSIGHFRISAGTLGVVVRDRVSGERLILSNNHVLANSNDAQAGDPVLQPGGADGGSVPEDTIAELLRFEPLEFNEAPPTCGIASTMAGVLSGLADLLGSKHRVRAYQVN